MKKPIKILISSAIIAGAVVAGYFGWKFVNSVPTLEEEFAEDTRIQPITREGDAITSAATSTAADEGPRISVLSDKEAFSAWVTTDVGAVYYISTDGKIYQADEGEDKLLLGQGVDNLISAKPSARGRRVLASFGDPNAPQWAVYDVVDGFWRPLSEDIREATFGKNEEEIYAITRNGGDLNLVRIDFSRNPYVTSIILKDFRFYDVLLAWYGSDKLLVQERPSANLNVRAWAFDVKKKKMSVLEAGQKGLMIRPLSESDYDLKFVSESGFGLFNKAGDEVAPVLFNTLPNKCTGLGGYVYCFAPTEIPDNIKLPDDYLMGRFRSEDDLYAVDGLSGDADPAPIWRSGEDRAPKIDAYLPTYYKSNLYFINKYDNLVYRMRVGR